jgi:RecA-family ATPase
MTAPLIHFPTPDALTKAIRYFSERCETRAYLAHVNEMSFAEAVDPLQKAAEEKGLLTVLSQDQLQKMFAHYFKRDEPPPILPKHFRDGFVEEHQKVLRKKMNGGSRYETRHEESEPPPSFSDTESGNDRAQQQSENLLKKIVLRPEDWEGLPKPERRWFSHNRIPMCEVTGLGGDGGIGKTLIALQCCVQSATSAIDWLGSALIETGPAIFLTAEEPKQEIHFRLNDIRNHRSLAWSDLKNLHPICMLEHPEIDPFLAGLVKRTGKVEATQTFKWFCELVLDFKPKFVCIESAADVFDVDEINRQQAKACVRLLQGLAIKADAAVMLLSHPSLSGLASGRGTSGSTHWNNTMRSRLYFHLLNEKGDDKGKKVLEVMKANRGPTGERVLLEYRNGLFLPEPGEGSLEKAAADAEAENVFLEILTRFNGQGRNVSHKKAAPNYAPGEFASEPEAKASKASKSILADAMSRLFAANKIHAVEYGRRSPPSSKLVVGGAP